MVARCEALAEAVTGRGSRREIKSRNDARETTPRNVVEYEPKKLPESQQEQKIKRPDRNPDTRRGGIIAIGTEKSPSDIVKGVGTRIYAVSQGHLPFAPGRNGTDMENRNCAHI